MLKSVAVAFGIIVFAIGVLGFIPQVTEEGKLLGIFHVNDAHNLIHVLTGLIGIYCGTKGECTSRLFFKVFGVVYAMIAALGFYYGDLPILGFIANNSADNILHVVIAVVALYLGFGCCGAQSGCCNEGSCSTKPKEPN